MSRPYDEQISALIDNELHPDELSLLLRRGSADPGVGQQLGRYALIRAALTRSVPDRVDAAFAERVSAAIGEEPAYDAAPQPRPAQWQQRFLSPAAGVALAASVAALAVFVWPSLQGPGQADAPVMTSAPPAPATGGFASPVAPDDLRAPVPWNGGRGDGVLTIGGLQLPAAPDAGNGLQWDRLDPAVQERLQRYTLEQAGQGDPRGWLVAPPDLQLTGQEPAGQ